MILIKHLQINQISSLNYYKELIYHQIPLNKWIKPNQFINVI